MNEQTLEVLSAIVGLGIVAIVVIWWHRLSKKPPEDKFKVCRDYTWRIWEKGAHGVWKEKRLGSILSQCEQKELDGLRELTTEDIRKINAERVEQVDHRGNPYWYLSDSFIQECKFRNPGRARGCGYRCMICGSKHNLRTSDDNPREGFCPSCAAALKIAMQKYQDLSDGEQSDMYNKEILEMMIALDLEDGVISLEHAKEDYTRIEELTQRMACGRARAEEDRKRQEEEKRQQIAQKDQAIARGKHRILS